MNITDGRASSIPTANPQYCNPLIGDGLGGGTFSWTAALLLDWMT